MLEFSSNAGWLEFIISCIWCKPCNGRVLPFFGMQMANFARLCSGHISLSTQIARFMGPTWGPPGSCRPQMGPMLAPWTLLSGNVLGPGLPIKVHVKIHVSYQEWKTGRIRPSPMYSIIYCNKLAYLIKALQWRNISVMMCEITANATVRSTFGSH